MNDVLFEPLSARDFALFSRIMRDVAAGGARASVLAGYLTEDDCGEER